VIYGFADATGPASGGGSEPPDPAIWTSLSFAGNAAEGTVVYAQDGVDLETVDLDYYFDPFWIGSSGISVSTDDPVVSTTLSVLGVVLGLNGGTDSPQVSKLLDEADMLRFDLADDPTLLDATGVNIAFAETSGSGQIAFEFFDDGALVQSTVVDVVGGAASYNLAGGLDFDAVEVSATGNMTFAVDDIAFLRDVADTSDALALA